MNSALIIGNGTTRKKFNLEKAKGEFTTFGCNALYRDFQPDYLVTLDNGMIAEILAAKYKGEIFVPHPEDQREPAEFNPNRPRENAGMVAMRLAIDKGHENLYCIGMDFLINDYDINMSNVYEGTINYGSSTRASFSDNDNRALYFSWFANRFPKVKFIMLFPEGARIFRNAQFPSNVTGGTISKDFLI